MLNVHCNTKEKMLVTVGAKVVGVLEGGLFTKSVCGSKHRLRCPPAWAVDAEAFDQQIKTAATIFRVEDRETGAIYEVAVAVFDEHKGQLNRGYGRQYFLPLSHWQVTRPNGNKPAQLSLWGAEELN